ncbi:MAG: helix-turn-helix domain-containing protein [Novosphingobium sp.]|nr:helix-turn-helix domain-containing protein [Novosphingobium sp.]
MRSHNNNLKKITYSVKQTCEVSSLGRTKVYTLIAEGKLKVVRVGGRTLILAESLHDLLSGHAPDEAE